MTSDFQDIAPRTEDRCELRHTLGYGVRVRILNHERAVLRSVGGSLPITVGDGIEVGVHLVDQGDVVLRGEILAPIRDEPDTWLVAVEGAEQAGVEPSSTP